MAQIFSPRANTIAPLLIVGVGMLAGGGLGLVLVSDNTSLVTNEDVVVEQPIPFSHDHHVGEIGLDCRYCHSSVEVSRSAGIPSSQLCMNCHNELFADAEMLEPLRASVSENKPIEWNRVHDMPDYVYFDHSIHLTKGIGCASCHGPVDEMPLMRKTESMTMRWCVDCHRDPGQNVRPREEVFNMKWKPGHDFDEERERLIEEYGVESRMSCSTCHR